MEKYSLQRDLEVFGFQVVAFPQGIAEAFCELMRMLPNGNERTYYGISHCTEKSITYLAATLETFGGEAARYGLENYSIEKGEYLGETLTDWATKTGSIRDVFGQLGQDTRVAPGKPLVEVYKNMKEMVCMVQIDPRKEMLQELDLVTKELIQTLSSFSQDHINLVPFQGSWSAAQVAQHVIKSNEGFTRIINGPVKETGRAPNELVSTIRTDFLDFNTKMDSPGFVVPANCVYQKDELLAAITDIKGSIDQAIQTLDLAKTCTGFELPIYGFLTRIEAIYFVIYHTQRHIHQLKNIANAIAEKTNRNTFFYD